jgi:cardiolipin synthase
MAAMSRRLRIAIPTTLSLLRLVFAAAFIFMPAGRVWFVIAGGLSDWLDGQAARRLGSTTWWGAILDAAADKTFTIVVVIFLFLEDRLAIWQILLLLSRDLVVIGGFGCVALLGDRHELVKLHVRWAGKVATVLIICLLVVLVGWPHVIWLDRALFASAALASLTAAVDYAASITRVIRRPAQSAEGTESAGSPGSAAR